jgi:hypothetical protein
VLPELEALGVSARDRDARTDEFIAALRALWTDGVTAFHGRFVSFSGVVGAATATTAAREARDRRPFGRCFSSREPGRNGWYGWDLDLEATERPSPLCGRSSNATVARPRSASSR